MSSSDSLKRVTIDDVARATGVSRQTVSRAINNMTQIDPATRDRVLAVARDMGYRPSRHARGMMRRSTTTVGLVIPDVLNPFFTEVVAGALEAAKSRGWQLIMYTTDSALDQEKPLSESIAAQVDACIAFLLDPDAIAAIAGSGIPFVLLGNEDQAGSVSKVRIDFESGLREAFDHLAARGHLHIGMIDDRKRTASGRPDARTRLYTTAAMEAGLRIEPEWIQQATNSIDGGAAAMERMMREAPEVTAILCYNDILAIGAMRHAMARGLAIPESCAFIGVDDIPISALVDPPLTTVHVDKRRIGQAAIEQLAAQMSSGASMADTVIRTRLVVRAST